LGGNTSGYFLRFMGKDTFILSRDVLTALHREGVVEQTRTPGKRALVQIQDAFNNWRQESSRSLGEISRTLAYSVDS
jgi:thermostable 8-oxoguanine DNA glycosylase